MECQPTRHIPVARTCPGETTEIVPPREHTHLDVASTHGMPATRVVVDPGDHGEAMSGVHGCGVKTPLAAVVAATTAGFVKLAHIPNGGMFAMGFMSATVAIGVVAFAGPGATTNVEGMRPIEHWRLAPAVTMFGTSGASQKNTWRRTVSIYH